MNTLKKFLVLIVAAAGAFYLGLQASKPQLYPFVIQQEGQKPDVTSQPSSQYVTDQPPKTPEIRIDSNMYDQTVELRRFPVYPGAIFIEKKYYPKCEGGGVPGMVPCDVITYTFETRDDFDQVKAFYGKSNAGWICSGGAGSYAGPRDSAGVTSCQNGDKSYALFVKADLVKTSFTLNIPSSDYKGKYLNY